MTVVYLLYLHFAFQNNGLQTFLFGYLRYSHSVFCILKLYGLYSTFFGYLRYSHSVFCILKLFGLDSTLFGYLRYLHSVFYILKLFGLDLMLISYFWYFITRRNEVAWKQFVNQLTRLKPYLPGNVYQLALKMRLVFFTTFNATLVRSS